MILDAERRTAGFSLYFGGRFLTAVELAGGDDHQVGAAAQHVPDDLEEGHAHGDVDVGAWVIGDIRGTDDEPNGDVVATLPELGLLAEAVGGSARSSSSLGAGRATRPRSGAQPARSPSRRS